MAFDILPPLRWNIGALLGLTMLLLIGFVVYPHWSTQYGAALIAFSIWMVWFVVATVHWLSASDEQSLDQRSEDAK